jgi:hypothetical protein
MGDLFQKFLNRVKRGYGQVDKNVFGGLLPGGAATPIGAAFQRSGIPKGAQPTDLERRQASLIDAAASGISNAQPFVERAVRSSPPIVQQGISKGLNALPFSVNLFGRYYTGIGPIGLEIPKELTSEVKKVISKPDYQKNILKASLDEERRLSALMDKPNIRQVVNDALAETRSSIKRMETGQIPYNAYDTSPGNNPLSSPSTSFGKVWFTPDKQGYTANEKYDFAYGDADRKEPMQQLPGGIAPLDPSQLTALGVARATEPSQLTALGTARATQSLFSGIDGGLTFTPSAHPLTNFGRSVVMKMPDKSFTYPINIR